MKDFKELYEQAIEATFSGELHKILYENELTSESLTTDHVVTLRNLFQRYTNLRNLGNAEFVEVGLRDRMDALNECRASNDCNKYDASQKDSEMTIEQINADRQMNIIAKAIAMMTEPDYENMNAFNLNKCEESTTHIIEHVDEPDMFECCACGADLKEFTKYCPHCGRLNIECKEDTNNG